MIHKLQISKTNAVQKNGQPNVFKIIGNCMKIFECELFFLFLFVCWCSCWIAKSRCLCHITKIVTITNPDQSDKKKLKFTWKYTISFNKAVWSLLPVNWYGLIHRIFILCRFWINTFSESVEVLNISVESKTLFFNRNLNTMTFLLFEAKIKFSNFKKKTRFVLISWNL